MDMRCPKCGAAFHVSAEGTASTPPATASGPGARTPATPSSDRARKGTVLGLGAADSDQPPPKKPAHQFEVKPYAEGFSPAPTGAARPAASDADARSRIKQTAYGIGAPASHSVVPLGEDDLEPLGPGTSSPPPPVSEPARTASLGSGDAFGARPSTEGGRSGTAALGSRKGFDAISDLPAPRKNDLDEDADLPALSTRAREVFDPFADDADLPRPAGDADLPRPVNERAERPSQVDDLDLPRPSTGIADLPGRVEDLDLPKPSAGVADLPGRADRLDLPKPSAGAVDLPGNVEDLDLPKPSSGLDLPQPAFGGDLDLPIPSDGPNAPVYSGFDDLDRPPEASRESARPSTELGGMGFGELDLGDAGEDTLEFDDLPDEGEAPPFSELPAPGAGGAVPRAGAQVRLGGDEIEAPKRSYKVAFFLIGLLAVLAAGFALKYTKYGLFGSYAFEQILPSSGSAAKVASTIDEANKLAKSDTYTDTRKALKVLGAYRHDAGLNRRLLAWSLLQESLYQVRFGDDRDSSVRSSGIQSRLERRGNSAPAIHLALAALALRKDELSKASVELMQARAQSANDPYFGLVQGELYLAKRDGDKAAKAFQSAIDKGAGARGYWGLARALMMTGDAAGAAKAVDATLEASPRHVGARIAKGRRLLQAGNVEEARTLAREAAGLAPVGGSRLQGSTDERAQALVLLGDVQDAAGERAKALASYDKAAELDPFNLRATLGAGHVLLLDRRPKDALARFRAVIGADRSAHEHTPVFPGERPLLEQAKLGAIESMIALGDAKDAPPLIQSIVKDHPDDPEIAVWQGRVDQALDRPDVAIQDFQRAIDLAPDQAGGYVGLARLYFHLGRIDEANAVLDRAAKKIRDMSRVHEIRAEIATQAGKPDVAVDEYRKALETSPNDKQLLFQLGRALREAGRLDEASQTLDRVAKIDPTMPGLALERGLIFEARGTPEQAVKMYEHALEEEPDDPDLTIRLAAAKVESGDYDAGEKLLEKVSGTRPNSAEAEFYLGRIDMQKGRDLTALAHFQRATQLDARNARYRLYLAWESLDTNKLSDAIQNANEAVQLDPTMASGYWIRGRVRLRMGAVADALRDLNRALSLDPTLYAAYASIGDCYDQLGKRKEAVAAYETALAHDGEQPTWWYQLSRLQQNVGDLDAAKTSLDKAIALGDQAKEAPGWLASAHLARAQSLLSAGKKGQAIADFQRYLELAPSDAPDRDDVRQQLIKLGVDE